MPAVRRRRAPVLLALLVRAVGQVLVQRPSARAAVPRGRGGHPPPVGGGRHVPDRVRGRVRPGRRGREDVLGGELSREGHLSGSGGGELLVNLFFFGGGGE